MDDEHAPESIRSKIFRRILKEDGRLKHAKTKAEYLQIVREYVRKTELEVLAVERFAPRKP